MKSCILEQLDESNQLYFNVIYGKYIQSLVNFMTKNPLKRRQNVLYWRFEQSVIIYFMTTLGKGKLIKFL